MCVRADGKYYTNDSSYSDNGKNYTDKMEGHKLQGNTLDEVIVEGRLFVYLKTFEKFINANDHVEFINLARTGVKIDGVPYMTYEDALNFIDNDAKSSEFDQKIHELFENQIEIRDINACFDGLIGHVKNLLQESLNLAVRSERLPVKFAGNNYSNNSEVKRLLNDGSTVNRIIESNKKYWEAILDGRTKGELAIYKRIIREIDFNNRNWKLIQQNKQYYYSLAEGCKWLLSTLSEKLSVPELSS